MTDPINLSRRQFLRSTALTASTVGLGLNAASAASIKTPGIPVAESPLDVDPTPTFQLSPYLYQQFMEPLGSTDGSVRASWDYLEDDWRKDVVDATRHLAPPLMRFGGCFSSYYRWKEAVGPRNERTPMVNLLWGGPEDNRVGTVEFVDFCNRVGADPLMCVNFEGDGRKRWAKDPDGKTRFAGPDEAAQWVDYCNNPDNALRRSHGRKNPCRIPIWQLGNETSYDKNGFDLDTSIRKTIAFAKAMRKSDPSIQLIGWGDSGWAPKMIEHAGEHLQYVAFHHMWNPRGVLHDNEYRKDPAATWQQLMNIWKEHDQKITRIRQQTQGTSMPLALTECHLAMRGRNRCEVLSSWAAGVGMARLLNCHSRHGDVLKIATASDFCGTRWMVNSIIIATPRHDGTTYLLPVAHVMRLYRKHSGSHAATVKRTPDGLDVTASVADNKVYLHVVNTHRNRAVPTRLQIAGRSIQNGRIVQIAADPELEIMKTRADVLDPTEHPLDPTGACTFPPASVSAVVIETESSQTMSA